MHDLDRRSLLALAGTAALLPAVATAAEQTLPAPQSTTRLWPGTTAPGLINKALADHVIQRGEDPSWPDRAMDHIRDPRIDVFPARGTPNGAAVLITPGGGYLRVVVDKEGYELADWLAARGVTAFVLFYRLPGDGWANQENVPLADAQRAMRLIRANAARWKIDPKRVAIAGFSAGGHLCADLATRFDRKVYAPVDAADTLDARPMLAAPLYPVVSMDPAIAHMGSRTQLLGANPTAEQVREHSVDLQVTRATPPCFLMHAEDDRTVPVENTVRLRAALKAAGVPVETHLFEEGGHGFGLRTPKENPAAAWPELYFTWAKKHGLLG